MQSIGGRRASACWLKRVRDAPPHHWRRWAPAFCLLFPLPCRCGVPLGLGRRQVLSAARLEPGASRCFLCR